MASGTNGVVLEGKGKDGKQMWGNYFTKMINKKSDRAAVVECSGRRG